MKFIYYNVDRLSLVLPLKTHRQSKGSRSREGKREGEMSIDKQRKLETVRQSATHSELSELEQHGAQTRCLRRGRQPVSVPDIYPAFTLTELIPHLRFWLWSPCFDIKKPREGREAKHVPKSAVGFCGQGSTLLHFGQSEQFKVGSALSGILEPVLKVVRLTWKPASKIRTEFLS